jgi:catechol 2,3-dioxygenase-like lactoylglutathione lyase family enzyme
MIDLQRVCYVRLGTRDLEGATRFATDVLGLEVGEVAKNAIYFKSDEREHTLCYVEGDPRDQAVAFEVGTRAALAAAAGELERLGHAVHPGTPGEAEARKVREFIARAQRRALSWDARRRHHRLQPRRPVHHRRPARRGVLDAGVQCPRERSRR